MVVSRAWWPGLVGLGLLLTLPVGWVHAQDVSARAYLSNNVVRVNRAFTLSVELSGSQRFDEEPTIPDMDEFAQFLSRGTSQQMNIVNGQMSVTFTITYRYQAIKEGSFTIPPIEVSSLGSTYRTEPLTVQIIAAGQSPTNPRAGENRDQRDSENEISADDLFLEATASRTRVYLGEPVMVEYRIYTAVSVTGYEITRQPGTAGFWSEEYPQPQSPTTQRVTRNGRNYASALIRKVALFPTSTGTKVIDPMTMQTQVRIQRSRDPFRDIFGGGSLFGRNVAHLISSEPVEVEVLPLPEEGRPAEFSGFVGNVNLTASLDNNEAETNEALTFRLVAEGEGNIRTLPDPAIDFPGDFEVYPPEESEQVTRGDTRISGTKTYEYVLIPRAPGTKVIPSIRLNYFDPTTGTYRTDVTAPITVEVTGDIADVPGVTSRARGEITTLREDIRFIQLDTPGFRPVGRSVFEGGVFWMVLLVPMTVVGGAIGWRRHRVRLEGDLAFARRRRATRAAKKRLAGARKLMHQESQREFYVAVGTALQGFLGDKLNIAEAGMIRDVVIGRLRESAVSQEVVDTYFRCLDECDRQRFAPSEPDEGAMRSFLEGAESAMSALDRELAK